MIGGELIYIQYSVRNFGLQKKTLKRGFPVGSCGWAKPPFASTLLFWCFLFPPFHDSGWFGWVVVISL